MNTMKTLGLAALFATLSLGAAAAENLVKVTEGEVGLAVGNARNEVIFSEGDSDIRFMMNRNGDNWYELQMATPTHGLSYGLFWRIREEVVGGLLQKAHVTQYLAPSSGRFFYSIDLYSDSDVTYHSYLVGHDDLGAGLEFLDSYCFAGSYVPNPHIWDADGSLYIGDGGPHDESHPKYRLYWSEESHWFGYEAL